MAIHKEQMKKIQEEFGRHPQDSGSTPVQIAALTHQIARLSEHLRGNKDFSCKRSLLQIIAERRSLLKYLYRVNKEEYTDVITRLGLKK